MQFFLLPDAVLIDADRLAVGRAIVVEKGRVMGLAPGGGLPTRIPRLRFPGEVWTAAPVLAHAHLESYDAPSQEWDRSSFSNWVAQLLEWREHSERLDPAISALRSLDELAGAGCGLVAIHVGEPAAEGRQPVGDLEPPVLPELLLMPELFAPEPENAADRLAELDSSPPRSGTGLALHAPFSVSEELARGVFGRARGWAVPVSIHLGEHREERDFMAGRGGPLAELFERRGRGHKQRNWNSSVDWLDDVGGLRPGTVAVHGGDLSAEELRRLAAAGVRVAWCPGTHLYFERPAPGFGRADLPVPALGCDSRASNTHLDPLREVRLARELLPAPGPQAWWHALTEGGAAALGRSDMGRLAPGRRARVLRFPWSGASIEPTAAELCDRLTSDPDWLPLGPAVDLPIPEEG